MHLHIIPRAVAQSLGMKRYLTLSPCLHGHTVEKLVAGSRCTECVRQHNANYRAERAAALAVRKREQYLRNRACPDWQARQKAVRIRDTEAKRLYDIARRAKIPSEVKAEKSRLWVAKNPAKRMSISKAYKARRRQWSEGGDSTADIHAWEIAQPKVCHWCGCKCQRNYHIDHYVALKNGGRHEVANLVIACGPCNVKKNAKDPYVFAASLGRLF